MQGRRVRPRSVPAGDDGLVGLDVEGPPLERLPGGDAADDQDQLLELAILCEGSESLAMGGRRQPEAPAPPPPHLEPLGELPEDVVQVLGEALVLRHHHRKAIPFPALEGLGRIDAPLVEDAADGRGRVSCVRDRLFGARALPFEGL